VDDRVERKLGVCGFEEQLLLSVTRNHAPPGKRLAAHSHLYPTLIRASGEQIRKKSLSQGEMIDIGCSLW
jgi:hypothetical protein